MTIQKIIKLSCDGTFSVIDVDCELNYQYFNESIRSWSEIAIQVNSSEVEYTFGFKTGLDTRSIVAFCDENGYAQGLMPNWRRPTDNQVIVGDIYFCCAEKFWSDDGYDIRFSGMSSVHISGMTSYFMSIGRPISFSSHEPSSVFKTNGKVN